MPSVRELEFTVGAAFLLGPMIYALTLPTTGIEHCEAPLPTAATVAAPECPPTEVEAEPTPVIVTPAEPSFAPRPFMFVAGDTVILHADAPAEWGRGELFEPLGEASYRAARAADLDRLPGDLATRVGRSIDLYGASGKLCTVAIERLTVVAQYDGWEANEVFGPEQEYDDAGVPTGISPEAVREALWATQSRWLIGELAHDSNCSGASWARDTDLLAPTILTESERSNPTLRARVRAFRRSPELAALEAEYRTFHAALEGDSIEWFPSWEVLAVENPARGSAWVDADGETRVVELRFGADDMGGCGDFDARLQALEVRREGEFEATTASVDPIAVFDADLDGQFELLYDVSDEGWGRRLDSATESLAETVFVAADWVCPC
jgi:hypothetical protein